MALAACRVVEATHRKLEVPIGAHQEMLIAFILPRTDRRADHRKAWSDAFGYMAIAYEELPVRRPANEVSHINAVAISCCRSPTVIWRWRSRLVPAALNCWLDGRDVVILKPDRQEPLAGCRGRQRLPD